MSDEFEYTDSNGNTYELPAGEWSRDDAVLWSFAEANAVAEEEAYERHKKWLEEIIEERDMKQTGKQTGKLTGKHARRAKKRAREQGMNYWDDCVD